MKAVVQRVRDASVTVNGVLKGSIGIGLLVYLGVARDDSAVDADWLAEKIINLRIFDDQDGKMNLSLLDQHVNQLSVKVNSNDTVNYRSQLVNDKKVNLRRQLDNEESVNHKNNQVNTYGTPTAIGVLAISQFTLLGDARKGRRPSWENAAPPEKARELYLYFMEKVRERLPCESGEFQARMMVTYTNDGPVTILLDSRE